MCVVWWYAWLVRQLAAEPTITLHYRPYSTPLTSHQSPLNYLGILLRSQLSYLNKTNQRREDRQIFLLPTHGNAEICQEIYAKEYQGTQRNTKNAKEHQGMPRNTEEC